MKRRSIIPRAPEPYKIKEKMKENLQKWVDYLKGLSPRVIIKLPSDKDFDLDLYRLKAKELTHTFLEENDRFDDWPEVNQVAFVLCYDSSLQEHKKNYLAKNAYIFCYYDTAFGLDYFEAEYDQDDHFMGVYSLESYTENALSWEYIAKIIKDEIQELEKAIPEID